MRDGQVLFPPDFKITIALTGLSACPPKSIKPKKRIIFFSKKIGTLRNKDGAFPVKIRGEVFVENNNNKSTHSFGII